MTPELTVAERPLPVVLRPVPDELLSSWLRRHVTFYGLTEPMFLSWLRLGTKNLRSLDSRLGLGQVTRIVEKFQCDPKTIVEMTHASLPTEIASLVRSGRPSQFCRSCWERHRAADAHGAVLKNWREGWRVTCPVCGSPLSEGERPRTGDESVRDVSPFLKDWDAAREGEDIVNRHLRGDRTPLASPVAMMRLLLILSWRRAETSSELYRKSWLLNEVVPGFDAEALRVKPSISKGATAFVPLHLRVALLAGLAAAARDTVGTVRHLRPACRPFYLRRFDELATAALGESEDFSI
jgi:TniQ